MSAEEAIRALREHIDAIDDRLLDLLVERASAARDVAVAARGASGNATSDTTVAQPPAARFAPDRERAILDRLVARNAGPLPAEAIVAIFHEVIGACRSVAAPLRIAVLGGPASNTHQAARERFGAGPVYVPARTIAAVFESVTRRQADLGVVPIENSIEGAVHVTLDCLRHSALAITSELTREVTHHLMAREGTGSGDVRAVYSHPQALGQCRQWLETHLPDVPTVETPSTAEAARIAAEQQGAAAIASEVAAEIYDLSILARRIEDVAGNRTRFLVLGREPARAVPGGAHRTTLLFATSHRAGALHHALGAFTDAGVNLTRLESRPSRDAPWQYIFFADLEGHADEPRVALALQDLRARAVQVKVLGSYPLHPEASAD